MLLALAGVGRGDAVAPRRRHIDLADRTTGGLDAQAGERLVDPRLDVGDPAALGGREKQRQRVHADLGAHALGLLEPDAAAVQPEHGCILRHRLHPSRRGKHEQGEGSERAFAGLDHLVRLTKPPESGTPIVPGSPRPGKDRTAGA